MDKSEVRRLSRQAQSDLGWLAAVHVALRSVEGALPQLAQDLLVAPELALRVRNYPPAEAIAVREKALRAFRRFGRCAKGTAQDSVGTYLNRWAIVYADAIIEAALLSLYDAAFGRIGGCDKRAVFAQCKSIEKGIRKQRAKTTPRPPCVSSLPHVKQAWLLAQLRHVVVHKGGKIDDKFLAECKNSSLWKDVGVFGPSDTPLWPDEGAFAAECARDSAAPLAVDRVVVPLLWHAVEFMGGMKNYILKWA